MSGKSCPKCGALTLWSQGNKLVCSKCGYSVHIPSNQGKGGKGAKCPACGRYTWFDGRCNSCGAHDQSISKILKKFDSLRNTGLCRRLWRTPARHCPPPYPVFHILAPLFRHFRELLQEKCAKMTLCNNLARMCFMIIIAVYVVGFFLYLNFSIPLKLIALIFNLIMPDPLPYLDEIAMVATLVKHLSSSSEK